MWWISDVCLRNGVRLKSGMNRNVEQVTCKARQVGWIKEKGKNENRVGNERKKVNGKSAIQRRHRVSVCERKKEREREREKQKEKRERNEDK